MNDSVYNCYSCIDSLAQLALEVPGIKKVRRRMFCGGGGGGGDDDDDDDDDAVFSRVCG